MILCARLTFYLIQTAFPHSLHSRCFLDSSFLSKVRSTSGNIMAPSFLHQLTVKHYWETYHTGMHFREKKCRYEIKKRNEVSVRYTGPFRALPSSSLARQHYVGHGFPKKLLPAEVSGYCFFTFRDKSIFQGGVFSPTPNPRLSWRAEVFCQGCLP
jgi:hypothetical protein